MRLFFDANVVLDVLARRVPWYEHSAASLSLVEKEGFEGFVAAHSVTTLYYLLRKHLDRDRATSSVLTLLKLVDVAAVDAEVLLEAFGYGWRDIEDAVQAVCALKCDADYLITRDARGFPGLPVPALSPTELLVVLSRA